jgi:protein SHQ1
LGKDVSQLEMNKASIGWDLEQLEAATEGLGERDTDSDDETTDGSYE